MTGWRCRNKFMSKEDNTRTPIIPEEPWMIQEARTVGLTFLYSTKEGCDKDDAIYVFIHRFNIVRMRFTVDMAHGIFLKGHVEQIGHIHYKEGEFSFDASPKEGMLFAVHDERDTIDKFFAVLNKKLLELESNNVF